MMDAPPEMENAPAVTIAAAPALPPVTAIPLVMDEAARLGLEVNAGVRPMVKWWVFNPGGTVVRPCDVKGNEVTT